MCKFKKKHLEELHRNHCVAAMIPEGEASATSGIVFSSDGHKPHARLTLHILLPLVAERPAHACTWAVGRRPLTVGE